MRRAILTFGALLAIGLGSSGRAEAGLAFGDILVSDVDNAAIYDVNSTTGDRTVFSGAGVGTGVALNSPQGIAIDPLGFVVVADSGLDALVKIDESTGDRSILSALGTMGAGASFNNPIGITTDAAGNIYVADQGGFSNNGGQVFEVNPLTGDRTVISGNGLGLGTAFDNIGGIAFVNGKLVVTDSGDFATPSSVLSVNPTTGNRTVISTGGSLDNVRGVTIGPNGTVFTANGGGGYPTFSNPGSVVNLALGSGNQTTTSGGIAGVGSGPAFDNPYDIATGINGQLYVTDSGDSTSGTPSQLFAIDPMTGARTVLSGGSAGSGPDFRQLGFGIAVDLTQQAGTVPEPATLVLLGQSLAALSFAFVWRRNRRRSMA